MKVELAQVAPDKTEGDRVVYDTSAGRLIVVIARPGASVKEKTDAAQTMAEYVQPGDLALLLPHGYELKLLRVVESDA
ncbi:hypothetical protein [Sorangium sp. So ce388]|uniref:hypothetical protein n=1 Tax=Sorangium sp. So ce388 TaxID=3133309 RepID=UPI003F5C0C2E